MTDKFDSESQNKKSNLPKISIITVSYNCCKNLESTILSVINQNYPFLEYIVIDGGSNDETPEILSKYSNSIDKSVSEPDGGIYDAMNKGLKLASGELVNFLNSGDIFQPKILSKVGEYYKNSAFHMAVGNYNWVYPQRKIKIIPQIKNIKKGYSLCHQAVFYQPSLHLEFVEYDIVDKLASDYKLIRKVYNKYGITHLPFTICDYDLSGLSKTGFIKYAQEIRSFCHSINDPFFRVEMAYWSKFYRFYLSQILKIFHLESLLFQYRRWKYGIHSFTEGKF